jgi:hypothetical protein
MSAALEDEIVVARPGYQLSISAPSAGIVRLTARTVISRSPAETVCSLAEIDIAADEVADVFSALLRWMFAPAEKDEGR